MSKVSYGGTDLRNMGAWIWTGIRVHLNLLALFFEGSTSRDGVVGGGASVRGAAVSGFGAGAAFGSSARGGGGRVTCF